MPKIYSGKLVIKILCRRFGFSFISQKGSHVKLARRLNKRNIVTVVPLHAELSIGTLKGVLDLAGVEEKDFKNFKR